MNEELYQRYLEKKAKKLGISVEELKARGTSPLNSAAQQTSQSPVLPTVQDPSSSQVQSYNQPNIEPIMKQKSEQQFVFNPKLNIEKNEVPSYIFGPSKMDAPVAPNNTRFTNPLKQNEKVEIKDTRENKFALIGFPLGHSLSSVIHEAGFKSLGINATYEILETPPDDLVDRLKYLKANNYRGFNVTIPLKLPISLFVNEVDEYADLARAVNTVSIEADKFLKAYNTDVIGFKRAIPSDINLRGQKVAVLGTGGAAHAACVALVECEVKEIAFFTRNIPNSIDLMNYVRRKFPTTTFNVYQIENIRNLEEYAMLVNTTPIGMLGKSGDMCPVETQALKTLNKNAVVYDVIYNPKKTVLLKEAEKLSLRTLNGLDMLIYQAIAAQEIWFNKTPDFKDMKIAALEAL